MTINEWLNRSQQKLHAAGIKTARLDALVLLERATGKARSWLLAHLEDELTEQKDDSLKKLVNRRVKREPLAYIVGHKEFYGLNFKVTKAVLIPRPESETLVDLATELAPKNGMLADIGTGSGALAIAIAKNRPDLNITATDVSPMALKIAERNAQTNKMNAISFVQTELLEEEKTKFDVVVANLPYLPKIRSSQPEILYEPQIALLGRGRDGLNIYRRFFAHITKNLKPNGLIIVEAEPSQHKELLKIANVHNLKLRLSKDFALVISI